MDAFAGVAAICHSTMNVRLAVLMLATGAGAQSSEHASSEHASFLRKLSSSNSSSGSSARPQSSAEAIANCRHRRAADVTAELGAEWADVQCFVVCPKIDDFSRACHDGHGGHGHVQVAYHGALQWKIFFLAAGLLFGAFGKRKFPAWVPYTVGLLLVGFVLGMFRSLLAQRAVCPMKALDSFDSDHNGAISREEWALFTCADCVADAVCADPARSCGGGDACWRFDDLDQVPLADRTPPATGPSSPATGPQHQPWALMPANHAPCADRSAPALGPPSLPPSLPSRRSPAPAAPRALRSHGAKPPSTPP